MFLFQGINTLWGSFEIKTTRFAKLQLSQYAGMNLEKNLDLFDVWAEKFEQLPIHYMTFYGAQKVKQKIFFSCYTASRLPFCVKKKSMSMPHTFGKL